MPAGNDENHSVVNLTNRVSYDLFTDGVCVDGKPAHITSMPKRILRQLVVKRGSVCSDNELLTCADSNGGKPALRQHIKSLRRALGDSGKTPAIIIQSGNGYMIGGTYALSPVEYEIHKYAKSRPGTAVSFEEIGRHAGIGGTWDSPVRHYIHSLNHKVPKEERLASVIGFGYVYPGCMETEILRSGDITYEANSHMVYRNGQDIRMGIADKLALKHMMEHAGEVVSRSYLSQLLGLGGGVGNAMTKRMTRINKAISGSEGDGDCITAAKGKGYVFSAPVTRETITYT